MEFFTEQAKRCRGEQNAATDDALAFYFRGKAEAYELAAMVHPCPLTTAAELRAVSEARTAAELRAVSEARTEVTRAMSRRAGPSIGQMGAPA